jgi:hypothetical protein
MDHAAGATVRTTYIIPGTTNYSVDREKVNLVMDNGVERVLTRYNVEIAL